MRRLVSLLVMLLMAGCASASSRLPATVVTEKAKPAAIEKEAVGGAALYSLTFARSFERAEDAAPVAEAASDDGDACRTEDGCPCAQNRLGEVELVFYPGDELHVVWRQLRGLSGPYDSGVLIKDGQGLWRTGEGMPKESECDVSGVETDAVERLLGFGVACRFTDETSGCTVRDEVLVRFVNPLDNLQQAAPAVELPWTEEISGPVYRYGDKIPEPAQTP